MQSMDDTSRKHLQPTVVPHFVPISSAFEPVGVFPLSCPCKWIQRCNLFYAHVCFVEIKYCAHVRTTCTRLGQQLEAAQRQHADLCKLISAKVVTLHTILLGVGGTCYTKPFM
eukprot:1145712-Pelagomonas_calceolata.AAC.6